MKKMMIILAMGAMLTLAACDKKEKAESNTIEQANVSAGYKCPMDCENGKVYDKPGTCPKCEMDLREIKK